MKKNWLNDINDRLQNFEADEPEGLWNDIEKAGLPGNNSPARKVVPVWMRWSSAAAVVLAIAFGVKMVFFSSTPQFSEPNTTPAESTPIMSLVESQTDESELVMPQPQYKRTVQIAAVSPRHQNASVENVNVEPTDSVHEDLQPAEVDTIESIYSLLRDFDYYSDRTTSIPTKAKSHAKSAFSVDIYANGGPGGMLTDRYYHQSPLMGSSTMSMQWAENPKLGLVLNNMDKQVETKVKHHMPIRTGVSVAYRLNERLSVGTGLSYSYLTSDLREGSENDYYNGEQKLGYIGVPINFKYDVWSMAGFDFYVSAGGMAEKCISGKVERQYVFNGELGDYESESVKVKPLQWSVYAAVGAQYNLCDNVGIYAEPSMSYYFDNGSEVQTIYNDKPLNFNLNLGLRLTFGK